MEQSQFYKICIPSVAAECHYLLSADGVDFRTLQNAPGDVFISGNTHYRNSWPGLLKYPEELKGIIGEFLSSCEVRRSYDTARECWRLHNPVITDYIGLAKFVSYGDVSSEFVNKKSNQLARFNGMRELVLNLHESVGPLDVLSVTTNWITLTIRNKIEVSAYEEIVSRCIDYALTHFEICDEVSGKFKKWTRSGYKTQHITIGAIWW